MRHRQDLDELENSRLAHIDHFSDDFADEPIYKCQNCSTKSPGYEEKEASLLTLIAGLISLLIFRLYAFLILPLVIESTKTVIKKCVKCDHVLDRQELLSVPSLTDKVLSFKCGSCAVVISRKYALVILAVLIGIWFFLPSHEVITNPGNELLEDVKWEDYVEDCGSKVVLSNQIRAKKNFDLKYAKNIVVWTGVVHHMIHKQNIQNPMIAEVVRVKMNPSDAKEDVPDLQLIFSHHQASVSSGTLNELGPNDVVEFKAKILGMGAEFNYHEFECLEIRKTGETVALETIPRLEYTVVSKGLRTADKSGVVYAPGSDRRQSSDYAQRNADRGADTGSDGDQNTNTNTQGEPGAGTDNTPPATPDDSQVSPNNDAGNPPTDV